MSDDKKPMTKPADEQPLTLKQVVEQLIPAAIASAVAASQRGQPQAAAAPVRLGAPQKCHECGQVRATGCGGRHTMMAVFPQKYPQHADYFPGVQINGVRYLSNDEGHKILVPADAVSTISGIVAGFEQNEQDMAVGRKAERHSGRVSPHGMQVQPANQAWR